MRPTAYEVTRFSVHDGARLHTTYPGCPYYPPVFANLPPDVSEYIKAWDAHESRQVWKRFIERGNDVDVAQSALDRLPEVDAIEALVANAAAVNLLIGRRLYVMHEAREAGATWEAIGTALRITKQGAQDYYRRQIEN